MIEALWLTSLIELQKHPWLSSKNGVFDKSQMIPGIISIY